MKRKITVFLWGIIFLAGSIASLFYVQGWRVDPDTGEIFPTGILDISMVPEEGTLLTIDNAFQGTGPQIIRGLPIGPIEIRLEKSGYETLEMRISIEHDYVTRISRIHLIPKDLQRWTSIIGSEEAIFWNNTYTAYGQLFPELKSVIVHDVIHDTQTVYEFPYQPESFEFLTNTTARIQFTNTGFVERDVLHEPFFEDHESIVEESMIAPDGKEIIFFRNRFAYKKSFETGEIQELFHGEEPIYGMWWMSESDDILVVTTNELFFWNKKANGKRVLLDDTIIEKAVYIPEQHEVLYKEEKTWKSVKIEND